MTAVRRVGLFNVSLDPGLEGFGFAGVGADDEDGVVAGDGADNFFPLFVVHCGSDRLRAAHGGEDDEEVLGLTNFEAEVFEHVGDGREIVFLFIADGKGVAGGAFHEFELADVARKCGLGDVDSFASELAAHVVLIGDGGLHQEVFDRVVALAFHAMGFQ